MRGIVILGAMTVLACSGVGAQSASLLPPTDPAYLHLAVLERAGLVPEGVAGVGPVSVGRVVRIVAEVRARMHATAGGAARVDARDLQAALEQLEARFARGGTSSAPPGAHVLVELEGGLGSSPGRTIPDTELGSVDVVVNPLLAGAGGRPLGDQAGAALAVRTAVGLGSGFALTAGGRGDVSRFSGAVPGRQGAALESLSARAVLRRVSVEVGRAHLRAGVPGAFDLVLGPDLPSVDLVRLSTDRPLLLHGLGYVDFQVFAADLGRDHVYPHARLLGWAVGSRPAAGTRVELVLLSKQGGEGAPEASWWDRIRDVAWPGDWLSPLEENLSDKYVGLGASYRVGDLQVLAEMGLTDVDLARTSHTLRDAAAYRVGLALPSVGPGGRHRVAVEGTVTGPHVYRHQPFRTGAAVAGFPQGSALGPDARGASFSHRFSAPAEGWLTALTLSVEERSADDWARSPLTPDALVRIEDRPEEFRARAVAMMARVVAGGHAGARLMAGGERVRNFAFREGSHRWSWTLRASVWAGL